MAIRSFGSYVNGTRRGKFVNHLPAKKAGTVGIPI